MSSASRFRTFSTLLLCLKITSLVCKRLSFELCSSDGCWANVTLHCHILRWGIFEDKCTHGGLHYSWYCFCLCCPPPKLRSPFGGGFYARLPLGVCYLYLLHFRLCTRHYRGCRREERAKELPFVCLFVCFSSSISDSYELPMRFTETQTSWCLLFSKQICIPLSSLSEYQNLLQQA